MAMTTTTKTLPLGAITAHKVLTVVGDLHARYARWQRVRRTLAEISHLDARQLEDIGLSPADLDAFKRTGRL